MPRHRGRCNGCLVKLEVSLRCSCTPLSKKHGAVPRFSISLHSLEPVDDWLVPVASLDGTFQPRKPCSACPSWLGVNLQNLWPLCRASRMANNADPPLTVKTGLVNARSLANKTFILKALFISRGLDFLCVCETWLSTVKCSIFSEQPAIAAILIHRRCWAAMIFKGHFKCKQLSTPFSSFELAV